MNRRRWAAVAAGLAVAVGVALLANPYLPAQLLSPLLRETFGFERAYAGPDANVLVVGYADSGSCPSEAVLHEIVQKPDRVVVTLTRTLLPGNRECTSDAVLKLRRIPLSAPLGNRGVTDSSRQENIPVEPLPARPPFR